MSFLGDILYPGNPEKRDEINKLQNDVINGNNELIVAVNEYNHKVDETQRLVLYNCYLQSMSSTMTINWQKVPPALSLEISTYSDPVIVHVLDVISAFGIAGVFAPYFLSKSWALTKLGVKMLKASRGSAEAADLEAALGSDSVASDIELATLSSSIMRASSMQRVSSIGSSIEEDEGTFDTISLSESEFSSDVAELGSEIESLSSVSSQATLESEAITTSQQLVTASGAFMAAGVALVVAIGVDLIIDAIAGNKERSALEKILANLEEAKTKVDDGKNAQAQLSESLDQISTSALNDFQGIYTAFQNLNDSLSKISGNMKKPIPKISDFNDYKQVEQAQIYLAENFSPYIPFIDLFNEMLSTGELTNENFQHPDTAPVDKVSLFAKEHKISVDEVKALMKWFYAEHIALLPGSPSTTTADAETSHHDSHAAPAEERRGEFASHHDASLFARTSASAAAPPHSPHAESINTPGASNSA